MNSKKDLLKILFSAALRIVLIPVRILPVRKNRVLFAGLTGGRVYDYSCNPKYIYEHMKNDLSIDADYVWVVNDPDRYDFLRQQQVTVCRHFSLKAFVMLLTSKVIVTNGSYAPWFAFRKSQYVINTWHGGGAYKKVQNETPDANVLTKMRADFASQNIDLFVSSCRAQSDMMIRTTYAYKGEVLEAGTPRNDRLISKDISGMAQKVRDTYGIGSDEKILLYAPTYRSASKPVVLDADMILKSLEKTGQKWLLLARYHRYQDASSNILVRGERVIFAADYPDMQELLAASDVLITDYSSCVWDYSFLKRPCALFVPDHDEYMDKNGFYVSVDEWPFPQARDMEELSEAILCLIEDKDAQKQYGDNIKKHHEALGSFETGHAADAVVKKITEQMA